MLSRSLSCDFSSKSNTTTKRSASAASGGGDERRTKKRVAKAQGGIFAPAKEDDESSDPETEEDDDDVKEELRDSVKPQLEEQKVELARALLPHLNTLKATLTKILALEKAADAKARATLVMGGLCDNDKEYSDENYERVTMEPYGGSSEWQEATYPEEGASGPGFEDMLAAVEESIQHATPPGKA